MWLKAYYQLKPIIPRRAQLAIRRFVMRRRSSKCAGIWPIDPSAAPPPVGWRGWPDGKRFALVLTHDVEGQRGLDRCLALADMEEKLGFRSSFNFLAEQYQVPPQLRAELMSRGFEVGVHGLTHDGLLYRSREHFQAQAVRINNHLKEWGSVGFRSPAMHRNFAWLGDLDIEYDSSSFDTDPFEPCPQGMGTIYPFLVGPPTARRTYVELPYTLPQDFTLFVVLRERSNETWRRKLDWIAERGGMALLIVHPDYIAFPGDRPKLDEYPAGLYEEFLRYVKERYPGEYWNGLPREIARFWRGANSQGGSGLHGVETTFSPGARETDSVAGSPPSGRKRRVLMIVENSYPLDIRVRREAEVVKARFDVTVISVKRDGQRFHEVVDGVEVFRLPPIDFGGERIKPGFVASVINKIGYIAQYFYFTTAAALIYLGTFPVRRYRVIHVHNPPDTLFVVGCIGKALGSRFVYDHHDLSPELYLTKYGNRKDIIYKIMLWCEKMSCKLADVVISTNESYRQIEYSRDGVDRARSFVVRNDPDLLEFRPQEVNLSGRPQQNVLLYLGAINPQDGVDVLLKSLLHLRINLHREDFFCRIIGAGDALKSSVGLAAELGLADKVEFTGLVRDRGMIRTYLHEAAICLESAPENELNRHSTFIKVLEYMSAAKPIVAFDLKETRFSTGGAALLVPPGDVAGYATAIARLMDSEDLRQDLGKKARARVDEELNWSRSAATLNKAYDSLAM